MVKRCIIDGSKIRISRPGVDVDAAGEFDFLLHENHLYAQPYFAAIVSKPSDGDTTILNVPEVTSDPIVLIFPVRNGDMTSFPFPKSQGSGSNETGWSGLLYMAVNYRTLSATQIEFRFSTNSRSDNVLSCYVLLLRRAN